MSTQPTVCFAGSQLFRFLWMLPGHRRILERPFFIAQSIRMGKGEFHGFEVENCLGFVLCCGAFHF
jgi:hypothetical protein